MRKAMLIDDKTAEVMYLYARACIGQEDVTNAVAMLTKAISLKEDYGDAYLLRGETLLKTATQTRLTKTPHGLLNTPRTTKTL